MAEPTTTFRIKALVEGLDGVEALKHSVNRLRSTARPASQDIEKMRLAASALSHSGQQTTRDFKVQVSVLRELRDNVRLNSQAYKELTGDLRRAEAQLEKINRTANRGRGHRFQTAATVASAGLFGGPETFAGAAIGGAIAGPAGAATGAIAGQGVRQVRELTAGMATYAAQIGRLRIALREVVGSSAEFAKATRIIDETSKELNIPIDTATEGFTKLAASVIGAGGTVEDTEQVFKGVSEAVKATGGDVQDLESAIRAMSQIFGKGKVSAEELQGQLGERLPGAVVKFANATNRTLPQLAKDLRDGTVGLNDVMKFATELSDNHRDAALKMAKSQEEAGARMKVALDDLKYEFGQFFKPVGAGIQDIITDLARMVTAAIKAKRLMQELNIGGGFNEKRQELVNQAHRMTEAIMATRGSRDSAEYQRVWQETYNLLLEEQVELLKETKGELDGIVTSQKEWNLTAGEEAKTAKDGLKAGVKAVSYTHLTLQTTPYV